MVKTSIAKLHFEKKNLKIKIWFFLVMKILSKLTKLIIFCLPMLGIFFYFKISYFFWDEVCNKHETFWTEISKNASVLLKNCVTKT